MLDSDIQNPDSRLNVEFYSKPVQHAFKTQLEGRPIFEDVIFVKISVPGDQTTVIDTPARDDHKARFPMHWQFYQNTHGENLEAGTPLRAWPILTAAQAEELRALKFLTVESIATASDAQLQRIGMIAGMAPTSLRERAQRYLNAAKDEGFANQQAEAAKKLQEENARLKSDMEEMKKMIMELAANQRKTPGRKPASQSEQPDSDESEAA